MDQLANICGYLWAFAQNLTRACTLNVATQSVMMQTSLPSGEAHEVHRMKQS